MTCSTGDARRIPKLRTPMETCGGTSANPLQLSITTAASSGITVTVCLADARHNVHSTYGKPHGAPRTPQTHAQEAITTHVHRASLRGAEISRRAVKRNKLPAQLRNPIRKLVVTTRSTTIITPPTATHSSNSHHYRTAQEKCRTHNSYRSIFLSKK